MPERMALLVLVGLFIVNVCALEAIIRKAGYSRWWVLVAVVPGFNVGLFLLFAFLEWPIEREMRFNKLFYQAPKTGDGYEFLRHAARLERRGDYDEALLWYGRIAEVFAGDPAGQDAGVSLEVLKEKLATAPFPERPGV